MRVTSTVTAVSWIPSEAITGPSKFPFQLGVTHYDEPPPDRIENLDKLHEADAFREANELIAWIEVENGRIVDHGREGRGDGRCVQHEPERIGQVVDACGAVHRDARIRRVVGFDPQRTSRVTAQRRHLGRVAGRGHPQPTAVGPAGHRRHRRPVTDPVRDQAAGGPGEQRVGGSHRGVRAQRTDHPCTRRRRAGHRRALRWPPGSDRGGRCATVLTSPRSPPTPCAPTPMTWHDRRCPPRAAGALPWPSSRATSSPSQPSAGTGWSSGSRAAPPSTLLGGSARSGSADVKAVTSNE